MTPEDEELERDIRASILLTLNKLIDEASFMGYVVTVQQVPRLPLAMSNYETVATIRPTFLRSEHDSIRRGSVAKPVEGSGEKDQGPQQEDRDHQDNDESIPIAMQPAS